VKKSIKSLEIRAPPEKFSVVISKGSQIPSRKRQKKKEKTPYTAIPLFPTTSKPILQQPTTSKPITIPLYRFSIDGRL
jgi:hypothetical protein